METECFSLCWNNFHSNLSSGFHSLLKDEDLVDVTLAAEGRFVKAHKMILSVCSPYFKDLFKANPAQHPIVILPDVNYSSLYNLVQFMYQGEVNVRQDEISSFLRLAELLKVKGLTEHNSSSASDLRPPPLSFARPTHQPSTSNGYLDGGSSRSVLDDRQVIERPRPIRKTLRPIQHLSPLIQSATQQQLALSSSTSIRSPSEVQATSVGTVDTPLSPRRYNDAELSIPTSNKRQKTSEVGETFIVPKVEPNSPPNGATAGHKIAPKSFPSRFEMTESPFSSLDGAGGNLLDTSSPGGSGGLMLLKSGRGQLVLIHNGHIYTHSEIKDNKHIWVCVKQKTLNCEGCITTLNGPLILSYCGHNHSQLHDVIQRLQVPSCSISPELL